MSMRKGEEGTDHDIGGAQWCIRIVDMDLWKVDRKAMKQELKMKRAGRRLNLKPELLLETRMYTRTAAPLATRQEYLL